MRSSNKGIDALRAERAKGLGPRPFGLPERTEPLKPHSGRVRQLPDTLPKKPSLTAVARGNRFLAPLAAVLAVIGQIHAQGLNQPPTAPPSVGITDSLVQLQGFNPMPLGTLLLQQAAALQCPSILNNGGVADGVTDNTAALAKAAAVGGKAACVFFPSGRYAFTSATTYTLPIGPSKLFLVGSGTDLTELTWPNASGGLTVNYNGGPQSFLATNMSITTGQANAATGVTLTCPACSGTITAYTNAFINVVFRGSDGYYLVDYWNKNVVVNNISYIEFDNVVIPSALTGSTVIGGQTFAANGDGVVLGATGSNFGVVYNFWRYICNYCNHGLTYGSNIQGVTVDHSNFTGGAFGVYQPTGANNGDQMAVTSTQFENSTAGIQINTGLNNVQTVNSLFIIPAGGFGIDYEQSIFSTVTGNSFQAIQAGQGTGIKSANGTSPITSSGNQFTSLLTGQFLATGSANYESYNNTYWANSNKIVNNGTSVLLDVDQPCGTGLGLAFGGASVGITYGTKSCSFHYDGRRVSVELQITLTSKGTSTGSATITGLPIAAGVTSGQAGGCRPVYYASMASVSNPNFYISSTTSTITLATAGAADMNTNLADTNFTNTTNLQVNCQYLP